MTSLRHYDLTVTSTTGAEDLFSRLDDPARFGDHMTKRTAMLLGGSMQYETDEGGGRSVGSVIRMTGAILGLHLGVDEIVTERSPPTRKVWETTGRPRLLIMSWYRMGFDISSHGASSTLRVFIDYTPADGWSSKLPARILSPLYAKWCVRRIVEDAVSP